MAVKRRETVGKDYTTTPPCVVIMGHNNNKQLYERDLTFVMIQFAELALFNLRLTMRLAD